MTIRPFWLIVTLAVLLAPGCQQKEAATHGLAQHPFESDAGYGATVSEAPEGNLFDGPGEWTSHQGAKVNLAGLKGRPTVVGFIYTDCPDACPLLAKQIKDALGKLDPAGRKKFQVVLVAFDQQKDTVKSMAQFMAKQELPPENFLVIKGSEQQTQALAGQVGFYYQLKGQHFLHNKVIGIAKADGRYTSRVQSGFDQPSMLAARLNEAL